MVHSVACFKFIDGMYLSLEISEKMSSKKTSAKKQKGGKKAKESSKGKQTELGMYGTAAMKQAVIWSHVTATLIVLGPYI